MQLSRLGWELETGTEDAQVLVNFLSKDFTEAQLT